MKTNKLIPLILTAALALSACASAADSATAAAAAETPESTAESAIEPGTEAVETDTLYGLNYSYSQSVVYEDPSCRSSQRRSIRLCPAAPRPS